MGKSSADRLTSHCSQIACPCSKDMLTGTERCQADLGAKADPMRVRIADLGESGADRLTSHDAQFACPCSKDK